MKPDGGSGSIRGNRDGAIIAAVARQAGWETVSESSSRGGKHALRSMIRHLERSNLAAHFLDGPTGPIGVVKAGAIRLAQATIVPVSVSARWALYFNSWDRFMPPCHLPGSRCASVIRFDLHPRTTRKRSNSSGFGLRP